MRLQLTIEETLECFGRETVAKWITRGMKIDHAIGVRKQERELTGSDLIFNPEQSMEHQRKLRELTQLNVEVK